MVHVAHKVIIDTDIGDDIDDALALALAALSPELEILAVTTVYGRVDLRAKLAVKLLTSLGKDDVPVARGSPSTLLGYVPSHTPCQAEALSSKEEYEIAEDGLALMEELMDTEDDLTVITLGPLSNIGFLLKKRPDLAKKTRFIVMGGCFFENRIEYNIRCDPEAVALLLKSGADTTMVGLDVTLKCIMSDTMVDMLKKNPRLYVLKNYLEAWSKRAKHNPILHDPLTVAISFKENLVETIPAKITVELSEPNRGLTKITKGEFNAKICVEVNAQRFLQLYTERVLAKYS
ncbi:MAG: hypothetical protein DRJ52_04350 [Thermoprotei archaeon]|nr:MAG: hypothetical protein DRJ52_04350 [Thermoprotei archaeon]HDI74638.1 hypothetical protein [Thermoprotei archaeon]